MSANDSICSKICGETFKQPHHFKATARVVDVVVICIREKNHSKEFHAGFIGADAICWRDETVKVHYDEPGR